jgi:hypothetical protein
VLNRRVLLAVELPVVAVLAVLLAVVPLLVVAVRCGVVKL